MGGIQKWLVYNGIIQKWYMYVCIYIYNNNNNNAGEVLMDHGL